MNKFKIVPLSIIFLLITTIPALAATPKMFFAEFRFIHPEIKEGSFQATSRKLWRIGFKYVRLEEAPDPAQNIHGLIISNAPDSYIINKYTNSGKHIVDRAETTDVHVGVFQSPDLPKEVQALEMGHENAFFLKHNAPKVGSTIIEGIECDIYSIIVEGYTLTLIKRKDNGDPLQLGIKKDELGHEIRYLKYEQNLEPDFKLFEVPEGIKIIDVN